MSSNAALRFADRPAEQACVDYPLVSDLCADEIEQRIIRSYVGLVYQAVDTANRRSVVVMRLGPLEVHLTEIHPEDTTPGVPPFWIEVFDWPQQASIDSVGCYEFDEDELVAAVEMIVSTAQDTRRRKNLPPH
ncbi:hypothetical protein [Microvirga aerophila]|uniref:Uncharacterized protein n=1 Tax=Microvirga aerophila TaxID=670291 RepID=A0A512BLS6_9HYPH|nr:hypothetical protein [Microvirga aerophila]GEO12921.1 hypothetical protein MAE02_06170 [Microvirga aerophila]